MAAYLSIPVERVKARAREQFEDFKQEFGPNVTSNMLIRIHGGDSEESRSFNVVIDRYVSCIVKLLTIY